MKCSINKEDLMAFLYGEIDEKKRAELKKHIKDCSDCSEELGFLQKERTVLQKWEVETPHMDFVIIKDRGCRGIYPSVRGKSCE